jgi:glycerol-3-phosphate dehydrogenase
MTVVESPRDPGHDTRKSAAAYDLFIIGGGINGCGVARDAAGRGLKVGLAEMGDLGGATSSASTKLFHGGLRYLEYFEISLVRHARAERETLLRAMPHISWPMRFVLPYHPDMRFDSVTPTSRILTRLMPWMKGRRPAWLIRFGLLLYDSLGGRTILPSTTTLTLKGSPEGAALDAKFEKAFEYSDCWIEDSRLVILNARDAEARGAEICVGSKVISGERSGDHWSLTLEDQRTDQQRRVTAKVVINAAGPWVSDVIQTKVRLNSRERVRLVRGSHIVTRRLYDHDKCYFFQGTDGRICFAIPYERDFTLIGTTDAEHADLSEKPTCTEAEAQYLIDFVNGYFAKKINRSDIAWSYSGVRPLYDDGAANASATTRDYVLSLDTSAGAPILNIFGGKITTYRCLAEDALDKIAAFFPGLPGKWTAGKALPGGDFPVDGFDALVDKVQRDFPFLPDRLTRRLVRAYGTETKDVLGKASGLKDLGCNFGADLYEAEIKWLIAKEYARSADDVLWRRSKLGLRMTAKEIAGLEAWMSASKEVAA